MLEVRLYRLLSHAALSFRRTVRSCSARCLRSHACQAAMPLSWGSVAT